MSNAAEYIAQERNNLKSKNFSREAFNKLLLNYINDPEFESHIMKTHGDVVYKITTKPVKQLRTALKQILIDFGVDSKDAEGIITDYKFKKATVDSLYDFMSDVIYQYLSTGRTLKLYDKEDVSSSISLQEYDEFTKKYRNPRTKEMGLPIKNKKHKKTKVKSATPKWKKETLSEDGKTVVKAMKQVVKNL